MNIQYTIVDTVEIAETSTQKTKKAVSYTNDVFFKYAIGGEDPDSIELRHLLIEKTLGIKCLGSTVLNSELSVSAKNQRGVTVDLLIKDHLGRNFNIEIQSYTSGNEYMRFQYTLMRIINRQLEIGDNYSLLKPVYQVVLWNSNPVESRELVKDYRMMYKNEVMPDCLLNQTIVYLPVIKDIIKKKGYSGLNDIEKYCYLLYNGDVEELKDQDKGRLVELMVKKYNELKEDIEVYTLAEQQEEIEMRYRSEMLGSRLLGEKQGEARGKIEGLAEGEARGKIVGKAEGLAEGLAKGKVEGKFEGKQSACIIAIDKRYHVNSKEWVETLSLNQLDSVFDAIYSEDNYDSFKTRIESLKA